MAQNIITIIAVIIGWLLCYATLRSQQTKQALINTKRAFFNAVKPPKRKATVISPREQELVRERAKNKLPHPTDDIQR